MKFLTSPHFYGFLANQVQSVDVISIFHYKGTWLLCLDFLQSGKICMKRLITERFVFSHKEVEEAFEVSVSSGPAIKVMFNH
ncbi:L-idonate 5-dehydrogenase [Acorus gramineus]|uniref:L-idonate 5-dehydrogenase n=1 Tax=Acorus gramineus TaxID=55184 RepID=A0AAV9ACD0_ACOGR|nr:L-idonate 5-dehydrogenase [Acorus gramineus]